MKIVRENYQDVQIFCNCSIALEKRKPELEIICA